MGFIVKELDANELILQLDSLGQLHKLDLELEPQTRRNRPKRSFSSAIITGMANQTFLLNNNNNNNNHQQTPLLATTARLMRASLMFLFQDINFKSFKEISAQVTIMAGLEKEFLRYDEIGVKKKAQKTARAKHTLIKKELSIDSKIIQIWCIDSGRGAAYRRGMVFQHRRVSWIREIPQHYRKTCQIERLSRLCSWSGYKEYVQKLVVTTLRANSVAAGESGDISFASLWRDHEIMYHVAALMPLRQHDTQQVHRKRYIGNGSILTHILWRTCWIYSFSVCIDIVCIVFMENKAAQRFKPESIRSQFLHVFIVVYYERINQQDAWRVEVLHNKNVKPFSPPVPSPPIFYDEEVLRAFLLLKRECLTVQQIQ